MSHHIRAIWSESTLSAFRFIRLFLTKLQPVKNQIRWHGCASWSGSTLAAQGVQGYIWNEDLSFLPFCLFLSECGYCSHEKCLNQITRTCASVKVQEDPTFCLDICKERGLSEQNYRCAECRAPISFSNYYYEYIFIRKHEMLWFFYS
jgi:hypothetical protein